MIQDYTVVFFQALGQFYNGGKEVNISFIFAFLSGRLLREYSSCLKMEPEACNAGKVLLWGKLRAREGWCY